MPVSVGGSITINIRDIAALPEGDEDCRAFCTNVLGDECWAQIGAVRKLASDGVSDGMRPGPNLEMEQRGVSVGISITGTF
jgi:hypothetical protein